MKTEILPVSEASLTLAKKYIEEGEVVAFHTETVYGLGANAFSDEAVKRIFLLKGRPQDNPLIAHVHTDYDISRLVDEIPPYAEKLKEAYLPGPLTMVYPSKGKVSPLVSCGLDTLAVRVPSSPVAQAFLRAVNVPIAAPSANVSKHVSPVTAEHVFADFEGKIPLILDGGACCGGIESTVLDCTAKLPFILREGLVTREMIARIAGDCGVYYRREGEKPKSPGMAYRHYCPRCATVSAATVEEAKERYEAEEQRGGKPYLLLSHEDALRAPECRLYDLGADGEEMAHRLYALLRRAEGEATLLIGVPPKGEDGVMAGVRNRFQRAFGGTDEI